VAKWGIGQTIEKSIPMTIHLHHYDLPHDFVPAGCVAIDTEAMGLHYHRDRLCLVQLTNGDGVIHLVHFPKGDYVHSPRLVAMLANPAITKLFHFARFDVALLQHSFNIQMKSIYCTKIAAKLVRTFTNKHGLKDLCKDLLRVELSKEEQTSDWGSPVLSEAQQRYAANDVLYLHDLKTAFDALLEREHRTHIAKACFDFLPTRARLDCLAGDTFDIFSHAS
jgi:ribonuclease D